MSDSSDSASDSTKGKLTAGASEFKPSRFNAAAKEWVPGQVPPPGQVQQPPMQQQYMPQYAPDQYAYNNNMYAGNGYSQFQPPFYQQQQYVNNPNGRYGYGKQQPGYGAPPQYPQPQHQYYQQQSNMPPQQMQQQMTPLDNGDVLPQQQDGNAPVAEVPVESAPTDAASVDIEATSSTTVPPATDSVTVPIVESPVPSVPAQAPADQWKRESSSVVKRDEQVIKRGSEVASAPNKSEGSDGWKRGVKINTPGERSDDGRLRYDKMTMFSLYCPGQYSIPPKVKSFYERFSSQERTPFGYEAYKRSQKGAKSNSVFNNNNVVEEKDYSEEEALIFSAEKMKSGFHYDPSRLATTGTVDKTKEREVIMNKANLTLNKLSLEKFDKLSDEFLAVSAIMFFCGWCLSYFLYITPSCFCASLETYDNAFYFFLLLNNI